MRPATPNAPNVQTASGPAAGAVRPREIVRIQALTSAEHTLGDDGALTPVLRGVDLLIRRGEVWGITGLSVFALRLLPEIIANIRPYAGGSCVLVERGMMRHKRVILPHVFYIGSPRMIYRNMNVLEFLMFATAPRPGDKTAWQRELFGFLLDLGLARISLTPIYSLPKEHRAVVILLAALFSESDLIVFNFPDYAFDDMLTAAVAGIAARAVREEKSLVFASRDCRVLEAAATHVAYLAGGRIVSAGEKREFCARHDPIVLTIRDERAEEMCRRLRFTLPGYDLDSRDKILVIRRREGAADDPRLLYEKLLEAGFAPEAVQLNPKTVCNACAELEKTHDLYEELL